MYTLQHLNLVLFVAWTLDWVCILLNQMCRANISSEQWFTSAGDCIILWNLCCFVAWTLDWVSILLNQMCRATISTGHCSQALGFSTAVCTIFASKIKTLNITVRLCYSLYAYTVAWTLDWVNILSNQMCSATLSSKYMCRPRINNHQPYSDTSYFANIWAN